MSIGNANCLICGAPIVYAQEAHEVTCAICGKVEMGRCTCAEGHYVCDGCHRAKGVDFVMETCRASDSTNPIELAQSIMRDKSIYPNGPEHHSLVGAVLLTCYRNAGGDIDLDAALRAESREAAESILTREITEAVAADPYGRCAYIESLAFDWTAPDAIRVDTVLHGIDDVTIDLTAYITKGDA